MLGVKVIMYTCAISLALMAIIIVLLAGKTFEFDAFMKAWVIICIICSLFVMRDAALIKTK